MKTRTGISTAKGLVSGCAFVYGGAGEITVPDFKIEAGSEASELERLRCAVSEVRVYIEGLISSFKGRVGGSDAGIIESHLQILNDPVLAAMSERLILDERCNAASSVRRTADSVRIRFAQMDDAYLRERVRDLDDVERRLLVALLGSDSDSPFAELDSPVIVVARDLTPAETVRLPVEFVVGIALDGGSATSHAALLARQLGIPTVVALGDLSSCVANGDILLLDGTSGKVTVSPDAKTMAEFVSMVKSQRRPVGHICNVAAGTLADSTKITIEANFQNGMNFDDVGKFGATGIGLYRSEYLWIGKESEPTEDEQFEAYRDIASRVNELGTASRATIRVLDIGGDKMVSDMSIIESNPFLGNRSIRFLLSNPKIFRTQLRAILRASAFGRVSVLYPMISCVEELDECSRIVDDIRRELLDEGIDFDCNVPFGAMIEVPAAAINADALAHRVDFFSIGTNDLVQYTMAADRGNESVSHLYQPMHPAVLKLVRTAIEAAKRNGIAVGVCGESAADPVEGALWIGMGADTLSMSPTAIPAVSAVLGRLTRARLGEYADAVMSADASLPSSEIRSLAEGWLRGRISDFDAIVS